MNLKLRTKGAQGELSEWRDLVLHMAIEMRSRFKVDYFDIDLRRGDIDRDYRDGNGLAHYSTNQWASSGCNPGHSQLQSARRLMTARDFEISDRYLKMVNDGMDEDRVAVLIGRRYKLAKGWHLPSTDMTIDRQPTPNAAYHADSQSFQEALTRSYEAMARIR